MRELVVGIAGSGKTRHCLERCREALAAGREVIYLVPNGDEAELVRARLLDLAPGDAAVLPGILTPRNLARRILDRELPGWSERSPQNRRLRIHTILRELRPKLGILTRSAGTAGFQVALDDLISELEGGAVSPRALAKLAEEVDSGSDRERLSDLALIYQTFLVDRGRGEQAAEQLDPAAMIGRAAGLLRLKAEAILPGAPLLLVDGFAHLGALEMQLLAALLPAMGDAVVALCLDPADLDERDEVAPPFEGLVALARTFLAEGEWEILPLEGAVHRYGPGFLAGLSGGLFRRPPGMEKLRTAGALALIEGAMPRDEAEGVLREIRRELASGQAPGRMAILFRQDRYGELFSELLEREKIPFAWTRRRPLSLTPAVELCLGLLDWGAGLLSPAELPQNLRGFVASDDALLARLAAAARESGVPTALDWETFLAAAREENPEADWAWLDWRMSLPPVDEILDGADFLTRFLEPLVELLLPTLSGALESTLIAVDNEAGQELRCLATEAKALGRLLALGPELIVALPGKGKPVAWTEALRRLADEELLPETLGQEGGGLIMGNPFALRLPELDTVFVCGLNEGAFPPPFREDPLLRDGERRALGPGLPSWRQRQARERYLFYVACTRPGKRLWLSRSQRGVDGRALAPSQYLGEMERITADWPEPLRLPALAIAEKLRDPVNLRSLMRDRLLAGARREASVLARSVDAWLRTRDLGPRLDAAMQIRLDPPLTEHAALAGRLGESLRLSASRLETYADCPFRFFLRYLLGLDEEDGFEAGAREEGRLYHKVLELFFAEPREPGADLRPILDDLYEQARTSLAEEEAPALDSPRFRIGDARRRRALQGFLIRDLERQEESGFRPAGSADLEWGFKMREDELPGAPDAAAGAFSLEGFVDRVDRDPEGRELVLDYKRGVKHSEPPDTESPALFQLALYAIARSARGGRPVGAAYYSLREGKPLRGYFREQIRAASAPWSTGASGRSEKGGHWLDDQAWADWLESVSRRLREIVVEIREGRLAPNPRLGKSTCKYCDYHGLCRWSPDAEANDD